MLTLGPKSKGIVWKNSLTPYHEKRFSTANGSDDDTGFDATLTGRRAGCTEANDCMSKPDSGKGDA